MADMWHLWSGLAMAAGKAIESIVNPKEDTWDAPRNIDVQMEHTSIIESLNQPQSIWSIWFMVHGLKCVSLMIFDQLCIVVVGICSDCLGIHLRLIQSQKIRMTLYDSSFGNPGGLPKLQSKWKHLDILFMWLFMIAIIQHNTALYARFGRPVWSFGGAQEMAPITGLGRPVIVHIVFDTPHGPLFETTH